MHQHDERYSPELADYVVEKLNDALGTQLMRPQFIQRDDNKPTAQTSLLL
jgi:hypothetical protein